MHQYKIRYSIIGSGTREEVVTARGDFEARRIVESRYAPGSIMIIQITKLS